MIRIGTLGCGRIVHKALLGVVKDSHLAVLQAVASERPGVAEVIAKRHQVPEAYSSYNDLLDSPQVDAVYVPCTGDRHCHWTIAAANAGKHVLCEKPLANSVSQAEEMVNACVRNGVILQEAFMWRLSPRAAQTKGLIASGEIGELRLMNFSFSFDIDRNDWRMQPEKGGGALWDIGCYGVNAARYYTGAEPVEVQAAANWGETGVDMSMRIGMTFPQGVLANIDCSFEVPWRCRAEIVGTHGRIILENAFQTLPGSTIQIQRGTLRESPVEVIAVPDFQHHLLQLDHFCRSIALGELIAPAENGMLNTRALEQILESARAQDSFKHQFP